MTVADLAIDSLLNKFGDDAESRDDFLQAEDSRYEAIDTLANVAAMSWDGIEAKVDALHSERLLEDHENALAIASSLAEDLRRARNLDRNAI
jgi:hypothetical protein